MDWSAIGMPEAIIILVLLVVAFCGRQMHRPIKCPPPVCGPMRDLPKSVKPLRRSDNTGAGKQRLVG